MVDPLFPRKAHPSQLTRKEKQQNRSRVGPQVILNRLEEWLPTSNRSFPLIPRTRTLTKHQVHNVGLCLITLHSSPDSFLMSFPDSSVGKEPACNAGDPSSIPWSGRSADEGIGCPLQHSGASLVAQLIKICLQSGRPGFYPWVGKISLERGKVTHFSVWPGESHIRTFQFH